MLVLRCRPEGLNAVTAEGTSFDVLALDLSPEIKRISDAIELNRTKTVPDERKLALLNAVKAGRDHLRDTEGFAFLGRTLFTDVTRKEQIKNDKDEVERGKDGKPRTRRVPAMHKGHALESIESYLKRENPDAEKPSLEGGEAFTKYLTELLLLLPQFVDEDDQRERVKEVGFKTQDELKFPRSQPERAAKLWQIWTTELPKVTSGAKPDEPPKRNADIFYANWTRLFNEQDRKLLQPFLAWSGGNIDKLVQEAERPLLPVRAELAKAEAALKRLQGDLSGLGPFSLDLEFRNPPPVRTVKLIEFIEASGDKPAGPK
jgi:hypothetical protein